MLKDLYKISLKWAYPVQSLRPQVVKIPENVFEIANTIKTINGHKTLQGTANLFLAMNKLQKPFPSFNRLIPAIYAYWNNVKGGSDTTTKLMDDCILRVPKSHLNPETAACNRLIMLTFVLCHRLFQVFKFANPVNWFKSLWSYREAFCQQRTFHSTLIKCDLIFNKELEKMVNPPGEQEDQLTPQAIPRRRQPS